MPHSSSGPQKLEKDLRVKIGSWKFYLDHIHVRINSPWHIQLDNQKYCFLQSIFDMFLNTKAPEKIIRFSNIQNVLRFPFHLDAETKWAYTTGQKNKLFFPYALREYAKINVQKCKLTKDDHLYLNIRWDFFPKRIPQKRVTFSIWSFTESLLVQEAHWPEWLILGLFGGSFTIYLINLTLKM